MVKVRFGKLFNSAQRLKGFTCKPKKEFPIDKPHYRKENFISWKVRCIVALDWFGLYCIVS